MMESFNEQKYDISVEEIVKAMNKKTRYNVNSEMITKIKSENSKISVYAAQVGDVIILCWINFHTNEYSVETVSW